MIALAQIPGSNNFFIEGKKGCSFSGTNRSLKKCFSDWKKLSFLLLGFCLISLKMFAQPFPINVATTALPPADKYLNNYIASGNVRCIMTNTTPTSPSLKPVGRIERISPSPFTLTVTDNIIQNGLESFTFNQGVPRVLSVVNLQEAFSFFNIPDLRVTGINLSELLEGGVIKLPPGIYQLCFDAYDYDFNGGIAIRSNPAISCATFTILPDMPVNAVNITTTILPPANPDFQRFVLNGNVKPILQYINPMGPQVQVKLFGKIESLSPSNFSVSLNPQYSQQQSISLTHGMPVYLTPAQINDAFGNFLENNLITSGVNLNDLKDANNKIILPEGLYKICFYARYDSLGSLGGYASDINLGCATVNICYKASAPQFTQPVSNFNINEALPVLRKSSPIIFGWTRPNTTCGINLSSLTYELEIRELYPNQTVKDAIYNPPVLIKNGLRSTTFLLDTILYNHVLKVGNSYVMRVRAVPELTTTVEIENNGYSREQAFKYGEANNLPVIAPLVIVQSPLNGAGNNTITTTRLKGKAVWSYKREEETFITNRVSNNSTSQAVGVSNLTQVNIAIPPQIQREQIKTTIDVNYAGMIAANMSQPSAASGATATATPYTPTISSAYANLFNQNNTAPATVSSDGQLTALADLNIAPIAGTAKFILEGASIFVYGLRIDKQATSANPNPRQGNQAPATNNNTAAAQDLLASGSSNKAGDFVLDFIDPKYYNITRYGSIKIVVSHNSFESVEKIIPTVNTGEDGSIDLGEVKLAAKTFRYTPQINNSLIPLDDADVTIYCEAEAFRQIRKLSNSAYDNVASRLVGGVTYKELAKGKIGETFNKLFYSSNNTDKYVVKFSSAAMGEYITYLGVYLHTQMALATQATTATTNNSNHSPVLGVKVKYEIPAAFPHVFGNASMIVNADKRSIAGAVVKVSFNDQDVQVKSPRRTMTNPPAAATIPGGFANRVNIPQHPFQATTDENGNFRIDELPILKAGKKFAITLRTNNVPGNHLDSLSGLNFNDSAAVNFALSPDLVTITGKVVSRDSAGLSNALVSWVSSPNNKIAAGADGLFAITNVAGGDSLIITRFGYLPQTIYVNIPPRPNNSSGTNSQANNPVNQWANSITTQSGIQQSLQNNIPAAYGQAVNVSLTPDGQLQSVYNSYHSSSNVSSVVKNIGKVGFLEKIVSRIAFVVTGEDNITPIAGAKIFYQNDSAVTDANGRILISGIGPGETYTVSGPANSLLVPYRGEIGSVNTDGTETPVTVSMQQGIKLTGSVSSNAVNLGDVQIFVDGKDYIQCKTGADGRYELIIPRGENTVKATRRNYVGASVNRTFDVNSTQDFVLQDGGGKDISTLMGFEIELEKREVAGQEEIWTGSFTGFVIHESFSLNAHFKIRFTDVRVSFDNLGKPIVLNNEVITDLTEIPMKLYDFIPIRIVGNPTIKVKLDQNGIGIIAGKWEFNTGLVSAIGGLAFRSNIKPLLIPVNLNDVEQVPLFKSNGILPADLSFRMTFSLDDLRTATNEIVTEFAGKASRATGEAKTALENKLNEFRAIAASAATSGSNIAASIAQYLSVKIYGFDGIIDISRCVINNNGLSLRGMITSPELPIVQSMVFDVENISIATDFSITDLNVRTTVNLKASIAGWSAEVNAVVFNMNGFKIGGSITIPVPQSPAATLSFSNVELTLSGIMGGSFTLPGNGLSIFDVVSLKTGSTPISFGEIGNSGVYKLSGSAVITFKKLFTETIEVPYFEIRSNGGFAVEVPVNKSLSVGFASYDIRSITVNATSNTPSVDIDGDFAVDVDLLRLEAGGIHFKRGRNDVEVSVDRIEFSLDIPGTVASGFLEIRDTGFIGGGKLAITGTPVDVSVGFHYFKVGNNINLGAEFSAGVVIPIGVVSITQVGGGIEYRSRDNFFSVTISGGASITGLQAAVELRDISVTVAGSPEGVVISGGVTLTVATLALARATMVLDFPRQYFTIGVVANISPVKGVVSAEIRGDVILSTKSNDTYFFLGTAMTVKIGGLVNAQGRFVLGVNISNARSRPTIGNYLTNMPTSYLTGGTLNGIYLGVDVEVGVRESDAYEFEIAYVASVKAWIYANTKFHLYAAFGGPLRLDANLQLSGGIEANAGPLQASGNATACADIKGGYNDELGWHFDARALGKARASVGNYCDCGSSCCTTICMGGVKICVGLRAKVRFENNRWKSFDIGSADDVVNCN